MKIITLDFVKKSMIISFEDNQNNLYQEFTNSYTKDFFCDENIFTLESINGKSKPIFDFGERYFNTDKKLCLYSLGFVIESLFENTFGRKPENEDETSEFFTKEIIEKAHSTKILYNGKYSDEICDDDINWVIKSIECDFGTFIIVHDTKLNSDGYFYFNYVLVPIECNPNA